MALPAEWSGNILSFKPLFRFESAKISFLAEIPAYF